MRKKRIFKRIALGILALIVVCIIAGFFVLRSRTFHRYILTVMINKADQATGGKIQIGDFAFHLSGLRVDLYRVTIHGTESDLTRPLLWVDHVGVNLKIVSLLGRKINIRNIVIDHPVVYLAVDARGQSNLPYPAASKKQGESVNIFNLAIGRLVLDHGEVNFNDRQIPLDAELRHLRVETNFNGAKTEYDGSLGYQAGEIQFGHFRPLQHNLDLHFSASPAGMRIDPLVVSAGGSRISILADLKNYAHPLVDGSYSARLSAGEMARVLNNTMISAGEAATTGTFTYQNVPGKALLDSLALEGRISSPALTAWIQETRGQFTRITGQYRLGNGDFVATNLKASVFGGRLTASVTIHYLSQHPQGNLTASIRSISLNAIRRELSGNRWARFPLNGRLSATAQASWHGSLAGLRIRSDASVQASLPAPQPIPIEAAIHAIYDSAARSLTLNQTVIRTPSTEADLHGTLGPRSALAIIARTNDLPETDALITSVRRFISRTPTAVRPLGMSGSASFQGSLQGTVQNPKLVGQLLATNLKVQQAEFTQVQTQVTLSPSEIALNQGKALTAQGYIQFQASLGLRKWTYSSSAPLALQLSADKLSLADIESLAKLRYPIDGTLSADVSVHGSALHPSGTGVVRVVKAQAWGQPMQNVTAHFQGNGNAVQSTINAQTPAGSATASLTYYPQTQGYNGQITLENIRLQQLHAIEERSLQISGIMTVLASGHGTLKSPQIQASLSIPNLRIGQQKINAISAQLNVANRTATFALSSNLSGASVHANGTVNLWGDYEASATMSTGSLDLGPLLAAYAPGSAGALHYQTEVRGWIEGPLKDRQHLEAQIDIPVLRLSYRDLQISSVSPVSISYQKGIVTLKPAELKGSGTDFRLQGSAPLMGAGPINASATGTVDLHIIQMFYPEWDSSGQLQLNVNATGSRSRPDVLGDARLVNVAVEPPNGPIGVQNMNGSIALTRDRAQITNLTAESGGGSLSASGFISYQHGMGFNLALEAHNVRVRYPEGVREVLESNLRFSGTTQAALISGQISIDRLSFTQSFDLASFASQFNITSGPSISEAGFTSHVKLNVGVRSSRELALNSSQLNLRGAANLRIQGTLADPVVVGRATLSGGELFFNGRRYRVESGVIDFVNPVMTEPVVNVRVTTTVDQYVLSVNFTGPFDRLRTTYTSDPPLPPVDVINLLLTGQTAEAPSTGLGAQSLLAQGVASQVSSRVQKLVGVSSLTIDPQMGGNGTNPGARIAIQQRVTRNLFFTFSVDTTTTQDDIIQLEYQLSRKWSVQAMRDQNGAYSLELRAHKTF